MANYYHTHFCPTCYGKGGKNNSGWWKCKDKKCTRLPRCYCKEHNANDTRRNY